MVNKTAINPEKKSCPRFCQDGKIFASVINKTETKIFMSLKLIYNLAMGCINFMTIHISIYSTMSKSALYQFIKEGSGCGHEINKDHS